MIFRTLLKNITHRILHHGFAARHYIDVYASTEDEAAKQAHEHVTREMRSFGKITQESVKLLIEGEPNVIKMKRKRAGKPKFPVIMQVEGDNPSTSIYNTELRSVKEAQKIAKKFGCPVVVTQQQNVVIADITVKKGKLPLWRVTFIEKEN